MADLRLTMSCWDYDRTRAVMDGSIKPDGIELTCLSLPVEETFFRMLRYQEFDIAEMSLSSYIVSLFRDDRPFVAIPFFPSRFFRHSSIYVNANSGISEPRDLVGKRVGCPEYQMTAPAWIRGILADEYDVPVDSVTYYTGGEETPNRSEKLRLQLPQNIKVQPIGPDQTLAAMLRDGEIDALYTARKPSTFGEKNGAVRRLFEDYVPVERDYFARTKIFPIMHTFVIRREVYERNRWIARSIYKALVASQHKTYSDLKETAALKVMLPWAVAHVEQAEADIGRDFWPNGFAKNKDVLNTFLRYSYEQGLSRYQLQAEDLFAPETLDSFVI